MYYAGIGSRATPAPILETMSELARRLALRGWILRSGGAPGADDAGAPASRPAHIYLPWDGFNGKHVDNHRYILPPDYLWARTIARAHHPGWERLGTTSRALMTRNTCQIFGGEPSAERSQFVICWTHDGGISGGTGQALRLAHAFRVEVFNLFNPARLDALKRRVDL